MNDYMTQNKIEPVAPVEPPPDKRAGKNEDARASAHAQPDEMAARGPAPTHDAGKSVLNGRSAGVAPASALQAPVAGQGAAVERGPLSPQETAAALFAPPDAAGAAAQLPAKVLAGRGMDKGMEKPVAH